MDSTGEERRGGRGFGSVTTAAGLLVALLGLYALSPLPVLLLLSYAESSMPAAAEWIDSMLVVFVPLDWLYEAVPFVKRFYDWYLQPLA